jgi:hypothetical protein
MICSLKWCTDQINQISIRSCRRSQIVTAFILTIVIISIIRISYEKLDDFVKPIIYVPMNDFKLHGTRRITLITTWTGTTFRSYLPHFFRSVHNNADVVDLLWININDGKGCLNVTKWINGKSNIRVLCILLQVHRQIFMKWLCNGWNCTSKEYDAVMSELLKRPDKKNLIMRPWLGLLYHSLVRTKWWAWVDVDTYLGDWATLFPWDLTEKFDVISTGYDSSAGLYLHGQLTAFVISTKMINLHKRVPAFASPKIFHSLPYGNFDGGYYSKVYLEQILDLNWIIIPFAFGQDFSLNRSGSVLARYVLSGKQVMRIPFVLSRNDTITALNIPQYWKPTFTKRGVLQPLIYSDSQNKCAEGVHNCNRLCVKLSDTLMHQKFIMRLDGKLLEHQEPLVQPRILDTDAQLIERKLFVHIQFLKHEKWFQLPKIEMEEDDVMEFWTNGLVTWSKEQLTTGFKYKISRPGVKDPYIKKYQ